MTTTNVFCGLTGDKNTSKVLKPPGGGHTDIFGAPEPPVKRDMGRNASSILEGTSSTSSSASSPMKPSQPPQKTTPPVESAPAAPAARTKVPPGGFSSGPLW